jgi:hypothetical protein
MNLIRKGYLKNKNENELNLKKGGPTNLPH